jgi:predicted RNA-binding Zn-ribbon protein involved in translation (DUF1610 family)
MNQLQQNTNLDISQAEVYKCDECGHDRFIVNYIIRRFSPLISPTGQEMLTPVQTFACTKCGHINKDFLPENQGL